MRKTGHVKRFAARSRLLSVALIFLACGSVYAQQECGVEVKVLLSPEQLQKVLTSLNAKGKTPGHNYFYDTPKLDLLSQGLMLRLRTGTENDLTVKLRPSSDKKLNGSSVAGEKFKCEGEITGGVESPSFSVTTGFTADVPETGEQVRALLSAGQLKLLADSGIPIDWCAREAGGRIYASTSWMVRADALPAKLSLELWRWPKGSVLELSTKAAAEAGRATYDALVDLAKKNGLTLSNDQRSKTATALDVINAVPAH